VTTRLSAVIIYRSFGTLRTLLALLVILQHVDRVGPAEMHWGRWGTGSVAVLVFFCLSGFVITEAAERFYWGRPLEFAANRALRILPQYVMSLALSAGAIAAAVALVPGFLPNRLVPHAEHDILTLGNLVANVCMILPGFDKDRPSFIPYVWALRVEVFFYILLAVTLWIGTLQRRLAYLTLVIVATAMFVAALNQRGPGLFEFVPYFALGIVAYFATRAPSRFGYGIVAALFALCLWTCVVITMPGVFPGKSITTAQTAVHLVLFSGLTIAFLILAGVRLPARWNRIDRRIGDLSFPLYLQQYVVLVLAYAFLPASYWTVAAVIALALAVAWLSDFTVEAPIRVVRDRIRGRPIKTDAAASPSGALAGQSAEVAAPPPRL
jgi:peptidoglycan/LPS O-acetylase OafA/YrhL